MFGCHSARPIDVTLFGKVKISPELKKPRRAVQQYKTNKQTYINRDD